MPVKYSTIVKDILDIFDRRPKSANIVKEAFLPRAIIYWFVIIIHDISKREQNVALLASK